MRLVERVGAIVQSPRVRRCADLGLVAFAIALWANSFATWPDAIVDFGHEVYLSWQIAEGRHLFEDLAWYATGPLSYYVNAALFLITGPNLLALFVLNTVVLILITLCWFTLLRQASSAWAARAGVAMFLGLFAFSRYIPIGNYNYVAPYSHAATHGMLLGLLALLLLLQPRRGTWRAFVAGGLLGGVFLTKPELFVALGAGAFVAAVTADAGALRASLLPLVLGGVSALSGTALLFGALTGPDVGLHAVLGGWLHLLGSDVASLPFYRNVMGLNAPWVNLTRLFVSGTALGLPVLLLVRGPRKLAPAVLILGLAGLAFLFVEEGPVRIFTAAGEVLPSMVILGIFGVLVGMRRGDLSDVEKARHRALLVQLVVAGALLAKMVLRPILHHYGFVLAVPAMLATLVLLLHHWPASATSRGRDGRYVQALGGTAALILLVSGLTISQAQIRRNARPLGTGTDTILMDERAPILSEALAIIAQSAGADDTLAVLPQGALLNVLARRRNPGPFYSYMPPEVIVFGEATMARSLREYPADFVMLVDQDLREYGLGQFGSGVGASLIRILEEDYSLMATVGKPPFTGQGFGVAVLRHRRP